MEGSEVEVGKIRENAVGEVKISKRNRNKTNYQKINNPTRQKLIEMVYLNDYLLKDAAKILGINYSTAKTILRTFRIEKRIEKKNADDERELKEIIYKFKKEKTVNFCNKKNYKDHYPFQENSIEIDPDFNNDQNNNYTPEKFNNHIMNNHLSHNNIIEERTTNFQTLNLMNINPIEESQKAVQDRLEFCFKKIKDFQQEVKGCFENIRLNQMLLHRIQGYFMKFEFKNNPSIIEFKNQYNAYKIKNISNINYRNERWKNSNPETTNKFTNFSREQNFRPININMKSNTKSLKDLK